MDTNRPERRQSTRFLDWFPVDIVTDARRVLAVVRNSSASGILMASRGRFEVGDRVMLHCRVGGLRVTKRVPGRVVRYNLDEELDVFPHLVAVELELAEDSAVTAA